MSVMTFLMFLYLGIGAVYALYILVNGVSTNWLAFPINVLGGPLALVYVIYLALTDKMPGIES